MHILLVYHRPVSLYYDTFCDLTIAIATVHVRAITSEERSISKDMAGPPAPFATARHDQRPSPEVIQQPFILCGPGPVQGQVCVLPPSDASQSLTIISPSSQVVHAYAPVVQQSALTSTSVHPQPAQGAQHFYCVPVADGVKPMQAVAVPALVPQLQPLAAAAAAAQPAIASDSPPPGSLYTSRAILLDPRVHESRMNHVVGGGSLSRGCTDPDKVEESRRRPADSQANVSRTAVLSQKTSQRGQHYHTESKEKLSLERLLTYSEGDERSDYIFSQLHNEPHLMSFYRFFKASKLSVHLKVRVLSAEGTSVLRWIECTQKVSHIDPEMGPLDAARILVSSHGLCRFQLLYPYLKTVYTKPMPASQPEVDCLLAELSTKHMLCPGLPSYQDKYAVLGYHPAHVRVLETPDLKRYDHEKCPIWHIPLDVFSKSTHIVHNMCRQCRSLQNNLVRLVVKACESDPAYRQGWPGVVPKKRMSSVITSGQREQSSWRPRPENSQVLVQQEDCKERTRGGLFLGGTCTPHPQSTVAFGGRVLFNSMVICLWPCTKHIGCQNWLSLSMHIIYYIVTA